MPKEIIMNDARITRSPARAHTRWILIVVLLALVISLLFIFGPMVYGGING